MTPTDNLIPKDLSKRPDHKELSAKGGRAKSPAKNLSQRIKALKNAHQQTKEDHFHRLLKDQQYSLLDLIQFAEKIGLKDLSNKDTIALLNAKVKLHAVTHGTKQEIKHTGNIEVEFIKFEQALKKAQEILKNEMVHQ